METREDWAQRPGADAGDTVPQHAPIVASGKPNKPVQKPKPKPSSKPC